MPGLEDLFLDDRDSEQGKLIQDALRDYFTIQDVHEGGKAALSSVFGGEDLGRENQRLDIELKKRQLNAIGPQDSQSFNGTTAGHVLSALGITWGKDFSPSVRSGLGASKDSGLFKIGSSFGSEAKEIGNGSRYLGALGALGGGGGSLGRAGLAAKLFG